MDPELVLPRLLRRRARDEGHRVFIEEVGGERLTYGDVHERVLRWGGAYRSLGVGRGETVAVLASARADGVHSWLGLAWLGALEVPVHTAYRGRMLAHVLTDSGARVLVTDAAYVPAVRDVVDSLPALKVVVVIGADELPDLPVRTVDAATWLAEATPLEELIEPEPWHVARVLYTSGTTGASKGVMVTWAQIDATARGNIEVCGLDQSDVYYSPFPLYHLTGQHTVHVSALVGGRVVMRESFDTKAFWSDIEDHRCTTTVLLGAMANFVYRQERRHDDTATPLAKVLMVPVIPEVADFCERFGVRIGTCFNMTEISSVILLQGFGDDHRTCGRVRPGYECRIVDEHDRALPPGSVGELVVRSDEPWLFMAGYWRNPAATAEAWRNQWMHTGDAFTYDDDGNWFFVDRKKDAIRRRGENISSLEVEAEVNAYDDVLESAAVAVASELGEDEVKVVVVAKPGRTIDEAELFQHLARTMPRFMVPRYIEVVDALPRTPTEKIRKVELREAGVTAATWDRVVAGLDVPKPGR